MSRPGVTQADIEQAATALQSRGKNPTVDSVREFLGTGSKSTITRHLRAWKQRIKLMEKSVDSHETGSQKKSSIDTTQPTIKFEKQNNVSSISSPQNDQQQLTIIIQKNQHLEKKMLAQQGKFQHLEKMIHQKNVANQIQEQRIYNLLNQLREAQSLIQKLKKEIALLQQHHQDLISK